MIAVDTSVWVAALRKAGREARVLEALLDADEVLLPLPVRIELLSGASTADRPRLRRTLSALPLADPCDETWTLIDRWIDRAGASGDRFGLGDLLIGALAAESGPSSVARQGLRADGAHESRDAVRAVKSSRSV